jgi:hypothetical protein
MGTNSRFGYLNIRLPSESAGDEVPITTLVAEHTLDGAGEATISVGGTTWVELAVSAYADVAAAVTAIGATPATLVVDTAETVSTALTIPSTLYLRVAKGAALTKSGSGTITFQGMGLEDAKSQIPLFFGFAAGDITWTGTKYPNEISTELWDTANTSLTDRINRADAALLGKKAKIKAFPRTITGTAVVTEYHHLYFSEGDYPSTLATYGTTYRSAFEMQNHTRISGAPGSYLHESPTDGNSYLIYAYHARYGGGESNDAQEDMIVENLHVIGDPAQTDISAGNSTILLGNCHNSFIRNCIFERTHGYTTTLGLYGIDGNYAFNSDISGNTYIGIGTQEAVLLNAKGCRIRGNKFFQEDSEGTTSYGVIDIEPNLDSDVMEDIMIEDNYIDARDVTDGSKYVGAMVVQAALSGSMKNITIRHNKIFGANIYPEPATFLPLTSGISVFGCSELYIYGNTVRGAFQRAYNIDRCRYVRAWDNHGMQLSDANGDLGAMEVRACADSDFFHNIFNKSPAAPTQSTGILEVEQEHLVTTSGSTITGVFAFGILKLFYDLYDGLTVTVNNNDYLISAFVFQDELTTATAVGTLAQKTFIDANVTTGTENIAITAHGHNTGSRVYLTTSGAVPAGLTANRTYFVIRVDADNLKLANTLALALAGTPVNITAAAGGGTHTLTPILVTKFSNNTYRDNKADDGITLSSTGSSVVYSTYRTALSDFVPLEHSLPLGTLAVVPTNTLLGNINETPIDPVSLRNIVGVTISGADNKQTKTAVDGWDAGAFSVEPLIGDGILETTAVETNKERMVGLSFVDTNQHNNTINYAIYLAASGAMQAYELGVGSGATPGYSTGSVVTFTRIGDTIELAKDGAAPFHTFTSVPDGPLYVDSSLYSTGATIGGIVLRGIGNVEPLTIDEVRTMLRVASGTAALGTSAIASGASASVVTVAATGVATTDVIDWGFNGDPTGVVGYQPSVNGMLTIIAYPTADNVNFKVANNTAASVTPGAITLNWKVRR